MRADLGRIQLLQKRQDGLQVVKVLLLDLLALLDGRDDLRHIGGQLATRSAGKSIFMLVSSVPLLVDAPNTLAQNLSQAL